jgi:DNA polymerase (family 10)
MDNCLIADVLEKIGTILEIKGENPFKSRAYYNAARLIETHAENLKDLIKQDRLKELPGIGEALQEKIQTLVETGSLPYYEELKASIPPGLLDMLAVPGLGPKKIKALYDQLEIADLALLEKHCRNGNIAKLSGFGPKSVENILAGLEQLRSFEDQFRYGDVIGIAIGILQKIESNPSTIRASIAGSLRRGKEIIRDMDFLASSKHPEKLMNFFCSMPGIQRVLNHGETKSSILLENGIQCDLRVVPDEQFIFALHHFTGSKEHNVAMRQLAISMGMKLSEWGLFLHSGDKKNEGQLVPCKTEKDLFANFGLEEIPPELRENMGEIEAARENKIPKLIEWKDLRGCVHNHTTASDGLNSLEEMAQAAEALGLTYFGIADHSKAAFQANGLSEERLETQVKAIRAYNSKKHKCLLLAGTECDILKDGRLDFNDSVLKKLDYVVASVHSSFSLSEEDMTKRIIRAMENPNVTAIGHLTGRLLLKRAPYAVNIPKILDAAVATGTWIELNANPFRLDLDWRWWKIARDKGVKCCINPDAHASSEISYLTFGIQIARKGWLRAEDVVNTLDLKQFLKACCEKSGKTISATPSQKRAGGAASRSRT